MASSVEASETESGAQAMALLDSIHAGDSQALARALRDGADPNVEVDGWAPARLAARHGFARGLEMLARAGADLAAPGIKGSTPALESARGVGENFDECLEVLARFGAPLDQAASDGRTPAWEAAARGRAKALQMLLAHGANAKALDEGGAGLAMAAAFGGSPECVELVLAHGAQVDAADRVGVTALMAAARDGRLEALGALLRGGASVQERNKAGMSALMLGVDDGQETSLDVALRLIEAGADPRAMDPRGKSAIDHAKDPSAREFLQAQALRRELGASANKARPRAPKSL